MTVTDDRPTEAAAGTYLEWALAYAERGIPVFPIRLEAATDGHTTKRPANAHGHLEASTDPDVITTWWTRQPDAAIGGYLGGAGLVAIDVDVKRGASGPETLADLEATNGPLPDTVRVLTPSGGLHLWFRHTGATVAGLGPGSGIDVKGTNGWVVLPPSISPEGNYQFEHGTSFINDGIAPAVAPDWLAELITPAAPEPAASKPPLVEMKRGSGDGDARPGDLWAAGISWDQLLEADGWALHHTDRDGAQHWTRPGKNPHDGPSARVGGPLSENLYNFSTETPGLTAERSYTKLGYLAATRFGGDHSAAARWLADQGYTTGPEPTSRSSNGLTWNPGEPAAGLHLPASFYEARPKLAHIRQAAHATARPADAVFAAVLAHLAALTPPTLRLPAPVGTPGTLDLAVAIIGRSGTGKSSSVRVAADLLPIDDPNVAVVSLGSGEGLIESYMGDTQETGPDGKTQKVRGQVRRSVLALLDEGQALGEIGSRKGSTLLPTIRSAWTGDRLGQANASADRRRQLAAGTYRFALIAGFQPDHATALLEDDAGGTPQRFLWLPAEDPTIPDDAPRWPSRLDWQPPRHGTSQPMALDVDVQAEIRARNLARARGQAVVAPLDAHRDLSRLKVAGLLAVLEERTAITAEDWSLAGIVLDTSDSVRASVAAAAAARRAEAEQASIARHLRRETATELSKEDRARDVMTNAVARHVHRQSCNGPCTRRCVSRATPGAYRSIVNVDEAIAEAIERGWITRTDGGYSPGESRPR